MSSPVPAPVRGSVDRFVFLLLALLWIALHIPQFTAQYSFDWDSANYARGVAEFNIAKHQPHPPAYPLWVLSARTLAPFTGGAMRAQIVLALLMTLAALAIFYALARQTGGNDAAVAATILLAFSPAVSLYGAEPGTLIVDLLSSCVAGYLVFLDAEVRRWRIVVCLAALGILAGFRESGVVLLVPMIAAASVVHWRKARREVMAGLVVALAVFLAWYVPVAQATGGWRELQRLSAEQLRASAQVTSVFYGATVDRHLKMMAENIIYIGMNLAAWLVAFGLRGRLRSRWRYAVWLIPNLVMLFGIHGARAGYWLLSFPPLLLILASGSAPRLRRIVAGVLVSLAISYFPYGRLLSSDRWTPYYLAYRSTPRLALDLEATQRRLDKTLHDLQASGEREPYVCARNLHEAPNIRTLTYDFPYVRWAAQDDAPAFASIWLFDQRGPDAETRQRYTTWERITGDDLISIWRSTP
ncbi:MAG TPA: glycosyltransferase family 39 protein [Bryobacteraceae bacterium]|nr:glycosyltransferase family 39 protein [Bryobacteraceae bacterium]